MMESEPVAPEDYLDTAQAARITPGHPSPTVVWRWMSKGVRVRRSGETIKLEHLRVGGKLLTRRTWIEDFIRKLGDENKPTLDATVAPPPRKPSSARRAKQIADAKLALERA